jgi:hypothetical protein
VAAALLCIVPPAAVGQSPLANPDAVVESTAAPSAAPGTASETPGSTGETTPDKTPDGTSTNETPNGTTTEGQTTVAPPAVVPTPMSAQELRTDPGVSSASAQPRRRKEEEAKRACTSQRPPVNRMLAIQGVIGADEGSSWTRVALFIAACFAAIALGAFLLRRTAARRRDAPAAQRGLLETASTVVAIAGTLFAIATQLITGPPPPEAAITVRDVLPRITRSDYARGIGADPKKIRGLDRREVGNVVLLEVQLTGYQGKKLVLQHASYSLDRNVSGTLLPGTKQTPALDRVTEDTQTSFVPIWVGYPQSRKFEAQFRLIENGRIQQLASTGPMKGSTYRYACGRDVPAV